MYVCMIFNVYVCMYVYVCMCVCVYVCVCVYMCMYVYTHNDNNIQDPKLKPNCNTCAAIHMGAPPAHGRTEACQGPLATLYSAHKPPEPPPPPPMYICMYVCM